MYCVLNIPFINSTTILSVISLDKK